MTDFLMTTWHGAGNTPPLLSVARALVDRGHVVRVLADPVLRQDVEAAGAEHVSWSRAPHRTRSGRDGDFIRDWEPDDPGEQFARMIDRLAVGPAAEFAADTREQIERARPAAVLTEMFLFGSLIAAEATGVPAIVLNPTINVVPADGVPPFGHGFLPARSDVDRERDRMFRELAVQAWDTALPALNAARREQGLPCLDHVLDQGRSAVRTLVLTSPSFDFVGPLPPTVKYVGPRLEDPAWVVDWQPPLGDDPLVLVALSSEFQDQEELLRAISAALGSLPVRGIVTTGQGIAPDAVEVPPNVQVVQAAPHSLVLRQAALTITHCGHGTTLKALAAGVPLVCLPLGRDQHDVAARVVHAGAGLRPQPVSDPAAIAVAVRQVLSDPQYRLAAARISRCIAEELATDRAVAEIEAVAAQPRAAEPRSA